MKKITKLLSVVLVATLLATAFTFTTSAASLGDVNGDGRVTVTDAKLILRSIAKTKTLSEAQNKAADVNGDGNVTTVDAKWVLQIVAGSRNEDGTENKVQNQISWDYENNRAYFTASTGEVVEFPINSSLDGSTLTNIVENEDCTEVIAYYEGGDGSCAPYEIAYKCSKCGKYTCDGSDKTYEDMYKCSYCGRTDCNRSTSWDFTCEFCGQFVKANTCHHCAGETALDKARREEWNKTH